MIHIDWLNPSAEFVSLDVETTGRSTHLDVVSEIAAIRYRDGVEMSRFVTLVKPATTMLPWIARMTGITDDMLRHAPEPEQVAPRLVKFLRRTPLVAHSAGFDIPLMERFLSRYAFGGPGPYRTWMAPPVLCTLRMARRRLPHLSSRSLSALAARFKFRPRSSFSRGRSFHSAGVDAEAVAHVFFCMARSSPRR